MEASSVNELDLAASMGGRAGRTARDDRRARSRHTFRLSTLRFQPGRTSWFPGCLGRGTFVAARYLLGSRARAWLFRDLRTAPVSNGVAAAGRTRAHGRNLLAAQRDIPRAPIGLHRGRADAPGSGGQNGDRSHTRLRFAD